MMHQERKSNIGWYVAFAVLVILVIVFFLSNGTDLATGYGSRKYVDKVAPGEYLPLSISSSNIKNVDPIDVSIIFSVVDEDGNVLSTQKNALSFDDYQKSIHYIYIPETAKGGVHTIFSEVEYKGNNLALNSRFSFGVAGKVFGMFFQQFIFYLIVVYVLGLSLSALIISFMRKTIRRAKEQGLVQDELHSNNTTY